MTRRTIASLGIAIALAGCGSATGPPAFDSSILGPLGKAEVGALRLVPRGFTVVPEVGDGTGQAGWYTTTSNSDLTSVTVTIEVGWGDCSTGCPNTHQWRYTFDGHANLVSHTDSGVLPIPQLDPNASGDIKVLMIQGKPCPLVPATSGPACANAAVGGALLRTRSLDGPTDFSWVADASGAVAVNLDPGLFLMNANRAVGASYVPGDPALVVIGATDATAYLSFFR